MTGRDRDRQTVVIDRRTLQGRGRDSSADPAPVLCSVR